MDKINIYNCTAGIVTKMTAGEFDRWYDHHANYREARDISEVPLQWRSAYLRREDGQDQFLVQD